MNSNMGMVLATAYERHSNKTSIRKGKMAFKSIPLAIAALALSTSVNAAVIDIGPDYGWLPFTYGGDGSDWDDSFRFTIAEESTLRVTTDSGNQGDIYEVFADGSSLGVTSATVDQVTFSTGLWIFQAGTHEVSGVALSTDGSGSGVGYIVLTTNVSAVPVPAAVWLFGSGLIGLIGVARRKYHD